MSENIKKDLAQAKKNYQSKKYEEAKELYESLYMEHPETFTIWDKRFYSWALYQLYVKTPEDETDLMEAVDLITQLVPQEDLSQKEKEKAEEKARKKAEKEAAKAAAKAETAKAEAKKAEEPKAE